MTKGWIRPMVTWVMSLAIILGDLLQIWFVRHLWWGHWNLTSRWIWFASMWGSVIAALVGAWLGSGEVAAGLRMHVRTSVRSPFAIRWPTLAVPFVVILGCHLLAALALWGFSYRMGFGYVEPWSIASGALWTCAGLLLGFLAGQWCPRLIATFAAPAIVFAVNVLSIQSDKSAALYWLSPVSMSESGGHVEVLGTWIPRLVALGCLVALLVSVIARHLRTSLFFLACMSATLPFVAHADIAPYDPIEGATTEVCHSVGTVEVCTTTSQSLGSADYVRLVGGFLRQKPELVAGVRKVTASPEVSGGGAVLKVGMGQGFDLDGQLGSPGAIAQAFAAAVLGRGCEVDHDLGGLLWLRLAESYGGESALSDGMADLLLRNWEERLVAQPHLRAAYDKARRLDDAALSRTVLGLINRDRAQCQLTLAEFGR